MAALIPAKGGIAATVSTDEFGEGYTCAFMAGKMKVCRAPQRPFPWNRERQKPALVRYAPHSPLPDEPQRGLLIATIRHSRDAKIAKIAWNKRLYRERNYIERMIGHLKVNRAIATRYDKLARSFRDVLHLATIRKCWPLVL